MIEAKHRDRSPWSLPDNFHYPFQKARVHESYLRTKGERTDNFQSQTHCLDSHLRILGVRLLFESKSMLVQ